MYNKQTNEKEWKSKNDLLIPILHFSLRSQTSGNDQGEGPFTIHTYTSAVIDSLRKLSTLLLYERVGESRKEWTFRVKQNARRLANIAGKLCFICARL